MDEDHLLQIRVTGALIEKGDILIVKQRISPTRGWSLPGGKLQRGETLEQAIARELKEETGLIVKVSRLLYVCDKPDAVPPLIHISFLLERIGGGMRLPSDELDANPIYDVKMVPIRDLPAYDFSEKFRDIVEARFPGAGSYVGPKESIGLA